MYNMLEVITMTIYCLMLTQVALSDSGPSLNLLYARTNWRRTSTYVFVRLII